MLGSSHVQPVETIIAVPSANRKLFPLIFSFDIFLMYEWIKEIINKQKAVKGSCGMKLTFYTLFCHWLSCTATNKMSILISKWRFYSYHFVIKAPSYVCIPKHYKENISELELIVLSIIMIKKYCSTLRITELIPYFRNSFRDLYKTEIL